MKRLIVSMAILLTILTGGGITPPPGMAEPAKSARTITVTDFRGRQIVLSNPAKRIVCLIESALSGLYMLGAEQRLVGVSTNIYQEDVFRYYEQMDGRIRSRMLPAAGNWDFVNVEQVLALKPDLVVIWAHQSEAIEALEERGVPVFGVFIRSFDDIYSEMLALGELTGTRDRAAELVSFTKTALSDLFAEASAFPRATRTRVYYMWAQGELETSGKPSTVNELIDLARGENVSGAINQEHVVVNMERILVWDPEVIVMWPDSRKHPADVLGNPAWRNVRAVKEGRVHQFPEVFSCDLWTLKFQHAVRMVAKWCYPDSFRDVDLEAEKTRLLRALYGEKAPVAVHRPNE